MRVASVFVVCSAFAMASGCAAGASEKQPLEEDDVAVVGAALSVKLDPIHAGEHHLVTFNGSSKYYGFSFHGTAGESISIYAAANKGNVDTVVYLYKLSATGHVTGRALASNDDTALSDWTARDTDSSIDSFVLPETRDYAIVLREYDPAGRGLAYAWFVNDAPPSDGVLPFPGTGSARTLSFSGVDAQELPVSDDVASLEDNASSNGIVLVPARVQIDPTALAAIAKDATRLGTFGYDMMYYAGAKPFGSSYANYHGPATLKPIAASDAIAAMKRATTEPSSPQDNEPLQTLESQMIASMLGDGDFATDAVQVYTTHWDNGDDTNAEGVMAIDLATGEARAVTFVNPP